VGGGGGGGWCEPLGGCVGPRPSCDRTRYELWRRGEPTCCVCV
jgi:hypothetical protein